MINKVDKSEWERLRQEHPPLDFEDNERIDQVIDEMFEVNANAFDFDEIDLVNSPDHYASGGIECIDAIEESMASYAFHGYLKGNCQKYLWRYEAKENPIQDLQKCRWYLDKLIEALEKEEEYGQA